MTKFQENNILRCFLVMTGLDPVIQNAASGKVEFSSAAGRP